MIDLDAIRARHPQFGLAIFAMDPAEPVVLEVYTPDGETFQWRGASVAEVVGKAFPPPAPAGVFD